MVTLSVDAGVESERFSVSDVAEMDVANSASGGQSAATSILEMFDEIHSAVPESAWDSVPKDGAVNYKHYLYGWPKVEGE